MHKRVLGALAVCLALSHWLTPSARADAPGFQRAINAAIADFEAGRFEQARTHFAEAHALSPSARTLRALGMVEFELRHCRGSDSITVASMARERAAHECETPPALQLTFARPVRRGRLPGVLGSRFRASRLGAKGVPRRFSSRYKSASLSISRDDTPSC